MCGLDCALLHELILVTPKAEREKRVLMEAEAFQHHPKLLSRLVRRPRPGYLWHADHIQPVFDGGGLCGVDNIRTLCVCCHALITREQSRLRADRRRVKRDQQRECKRVERERERDRRQRYRHLEKDRQRRQRLEERARAQRRSRQEQAIRRIRKQGMGGA
eukprot:Tamp_28565.p2 GENE.Tamp_28565~~Tamp_28565.p2  ORF type:complete len:161 (+),score=10.69 Tamp_28565:208-690(+)